LGDGQFGSEQHGLEVDRDLHDTWQVRVVELVRVTDPLMGDPFKVLAPERVAIATVKL